MTIVAPPPLVVESYAIAFLPRHYKDLIILGLRPIFFNIPVELVIRDPGVYAPKQGRAWATGKYLDPETNVPKSYQEIARRSDFSGLSNYHQLHLMEIWSDIGDDGHVFYTIDGYAIVTNIDAAIALFHEAPYKLYQHTSAIWKEPETP